LTSQDASVTAVFTNGSAYQGTVVIGCDGAHSKVRRSLFGVGEAEAIPVDGVLHLSATLQYGDADKARYLRQTSHPVLAMAVHPDIFATIGMQHVQHPDKPEDWEFMLFLAIQEKDLPTTGSGTVKLFKDKAAGLAEVYRQDLAM
jgi:2-polyprenyl-6-methoxyphenol hydroxylase-like FAD-dependent oxidoreductase